MDKVREGTDAGAARRGHGLPAAEDPYWLLVNSVRDYGIFLLDAAGTVRSWNAGAELITGYAADDIIGRDFEVFYTRDEAEGGWPARELDLASRNGRVEDEGWRVQRDGQRFWASVVTTAMRRLDNTLYGYSVILRDLTARKHREDMLHRSAERSRKLWTESVKDPMTGCFNRRYMDEQLRSALERAGWVTASLIAFDVDYFKQVNDRFGHAAGDTVLMGVAAVAQRLSRDSDLLFRIGGDEFVLYLPGVGDAGAAAIAERLRAAVHGAVLVPHERVSVSLGIAELRPQETAEQWLKRADGALYAAKRRGRNQLAHADTAEVPPVS